MMFQERFDLLIESGQANEQSVAGTRLVIELVEKHYGIQLTEELGASLVNHLAITLKQILDGKKLTEVPDVVWQELQSYPQEIALAETIVTQLESRLKILLARDELGFIAIHLCKIKLEAGLDHRREGLP
jgi:transcriptional regulatory protein LevR